MVVASASALLQMANSTQQGALESASQSSKWTLPIGQVRSMLLIVTDGKSSDEAAVREYGGADRCAATAELIGARLASE
jgi:hypothetical protein